MAKKSILSTKLILLVSAYFCSFFVQAQDMDVTYSIGYLPYPTAGAEIECNELELQINELYSSLFRFIGGQPNSITIQQSETANGKSYRYAAAAKKLYANGKSERFIYYRCKDITDAVLKAVDGVVIKSILLHELAHHVNGDPYTRPLIFDAEYSADEYVGFKLSQLGIPLEKALVAFETLTEVEPSNGYPNRVQRVQAVTEGWNLAYENLINLPLALKSISKISPSSWHSSEAIDLFVSNTIERYELKSTINIRKFIDSVDVDSNVNRIIIDDAVTQFDNFYIDDNFLYYDDSGILLPVGKVRESNLEEFNLMIVDRYYNYIYIDEENILVVHHPNAEGIIEKIPIGEIRLK